MGRARTLERRREREQQKKRQRQITIVIGVVVFAVIAGILLLLINQPAEAGIPETAVARYEGISQTKTDEGFPKLGSDDAPVKLVEYASFDCPHCEEFHANVLPSLINQVRAGQLQITYIPVFGTGGIANGEGAAKAAICAGEQGQFWAFHDALFTWQVQYANTAFSQNRLSTGIANLGLNVDQWNACMGTSMPGDVVAAAVSAGQVQNIPGTPAIFVNGTLVQTPDTTSLSQAISDALAAAPPVQPTTAPTIEATVESTAEAISEATTEATAEATTATEATTEATAEATP